MDEPKENLRVASVAQRAMLDQGWAGCGEWYSKMNEHSRGVFQGLLEGDGDVTTLRQCQEIVLRTIRVLARITLDELAVREAESLIEGELQ